MTVATKEHQTFSLTCDKITAVNEIQRPEHICQKHWDEWINSGVSPEIISLNVRTVSDSREVDRLLNRNTKQRTKHSDTLVPCWVVTGQDPLGWERTEEGVQIKPDTPPIDDKGKPKKYFGATGYDAAPLFLETSDPYYWEKVQKDTLISMFVTEGAKKAGAGLSVSLATVSIPGVSTCRKMGRLHRNLEIFCKFGRTIFLCFDNDAMTKKSVQLALLAMGREISAKGAKVMVITLPPGEAKGMDDFIAQHGEEEFKKLVDDALTIEEWKKQLESNWEREKLSKDLSLPKSERIPPADIFASELAEKYENKFKWNNEHKTWMEYEKELAGIWTPIDNHIMECHIQTILEARGIEGYGTDSYIQNIRKFMMRKLNLNTWDERGNVLPHLDGIVDIVTGKFEEHSPENYLTWCLPRKYNVLEVSDWGAIRNWLTEISQGDDKTFKTLTHFAAATLRGRYDLQKVLYLWGDGGSGKGTYTRLLEAIIGEVNCWNGKIESLDDPNQVARLLNKKLAIFPDQDKVFGKLQNFKRLTGGDKVNAKLLYQNPFEFYFKGLALITANFAILQGGGVGRWFERRVIALKLNFTPATVRNLDAEFAPEIAAFTKYLLSISDSEINAVLRDELHTGQTDPNFWEMAVRQDSLASWVDQHIIFDPNARTRVGSNKYECPGDDYNPQTCSLFGSYHRYCHQGNLQGKGVNNFSPELEEILRKVLRHPEVRRDRNREGSFFVGIRLRTPMDDIPTFSEALINRCDEPVTDIVTDSVTDSNACGDRGDGLSEEKKVEISTPNEFEKNENPPKSGQTIEDVHHTPSQQGFQARHTKGEPANQSKNQEKEQEIGNKQSTPTLANQLESALLTSNKDAVGKLVLDAKVSSEDLKEATANFSPEQIASIKDAANKSWKPAIEGKCSYAEYCGEKVQVWEAGSGNIKVKTAAGTSIKVRREQLRPWLEI